MPSASPYTLVAFIGYMAGVFLLGALAHKLLKRGSFLKEYFLGDRQLNAWVLGLTYVATSVSAGSFVGFPSLIYMHGWIMALWIAGYMVSGLISKGVLAKRLNQVSRFSGAITVPDVLRDRFQSPALGLFAGLFLLLFLIFNLVGQFKAGGLIMQEACGGVKETPVYQAARDGVKSTLTGTGMWDQAKAKRQKGSLFGPDYPDYILGILIFALTVVAYTTYGGFWAVTWTDVLQGIVIVVGAVLLMILALREVGSLSQATSKLQTMDPQLITGPGPKKFLPLGLAISFFFLWTIGSMGQPVGMVRLMACRDTPTLRTSLFMIGFYYALIYLPLVITFICARALLPTDYINNSDRIMPVMALKVTEDMPLVGGLILAAPYAAAMSAVAGFLLLMSSSLVRDIYQRNINPNISAGTVKKISYGTTAVVGIIVTLAAFHPPQFLQYLIIFTGAGMACTFLAPTVFALYWKRATRAGALSGLVSGFATVSILYVLGWMAVGKPTTWPSLNTSTVGLLADPTGYGPLLAASALNPERIALGARGELGPQGENFAPLYLFDLDPVLYGLAVSFVLGIVVSLLTKPLPQEHVNRYFLVEATPDAEAIMENKTGIVARKGAKS
jgi:SSS family solute:Na+ symporter/sodium/pantothenate symporter